MNVIGSIASLASSIGIQSFISEVLQIIMFHLFTLEFINVTATILTRSITTVFSIDFPILIKFHSNFCVSISVLSIQLRITPTKTIHPITHDKMIVASHGLRKATIVSAIVNIVRNIHAEKIIHKTSSLRKDSLCS